MPARDDVTISSVKSVAHSLPSDNVLALSFVLLTLWRSRGSICSLTPSPDWQRFPLLVCGLCAWKSRNPGWIFLLGMCTISSQSFGNPYSQKALLNRFLLNDYFISFDYNSFITQHPLSSYHYVKPTPKAFYLRWKAEQSARIAQFIQLAQHQRRFSLPTHFDPANSSYRCFVSGQVRSNLQQQKPQLPWPSNRNRVEQQQRSRSSSSGPSQGDLVFQPPRSREEVKLCTTIVSTSTTYQGTFSPPEVLREMQIIHLQSRPSELHPNFTHSL